MPQPKWDARYVSGDLPWDTGVPDPHLIELVESGVLTLGRALEVGCGTGTNAIWLAERGFEVVGVDLSPAAIEEASSRCDAVSVDVRFAVLDFLASEVPGGPFDLVFDRQVFHVFGADELRTQFTRQVARSLAPGGDG